MQAPSPDPLPPSLDDPPTRERAVRNLLIAAGPLFVGSWLLAAVQGATTGVALIIAGLALAGCLGAALSIHLLGSNARYVMMALILLTSVASFLMAR